MYAVLVECAPVNNELFWADLRRVNRARVCVCAVPDPVAGH